jgi:hypothetical protein
MLCVILTGALTPYIKWIMYDLALCDRNEYTLFSFENSNPRNMLYVSLNLHDRDTDINKDWSA